MFTRIGHFLDTWEHESAQTRRVLAQLTDESLQCRVTPGHRTVAEIAWHLTTALHEIAGKTGLSFEAPTNADAQPKTAAAIREAYGAAARNLADVVARTWVDQSLEEVHQVYGMPWTSGYTLMVLLHHEIHHRGQLTVLLRQAGFEYRACTDRRATTSEPQAMCYRLGCRKQ